MHGCVVVLGLMSVRADEAGDCVFIFYTTLVSYLTHTPPSIGHPATLDRKQLRQSPLALKSTPCYCIRVSSKTGPSEYTQASMRDVTPAAIA